MFLCQSLFVHCADLVFNYNFTSWNNPWILGERRVQGNFIARCQQVCLSRHIRSRLEMLLNRSTVLYSYISYPLIYCREYFDLHLLQTLM